jgi:hypothetical protein
MLNAGPYDKGVRRQGNGAGATHVAHLVDESLPDHLAAATCVYFDGIADDLCIPDMLDLVEGWFLKYESRPKVVLVEPSQKKVPRCTVKSLRAAASLDHAAFKHSFNTLQFFPKGRTTVDDTWRPKIYFAMSARRPTSAFFCVNDDVCATDLLPFLQMGDKVFRSCASYGFWFPERFSPLGYYWGIVVEPAGRKDGAWGKRELKRLSHWRDNTSIGIMSGPDRRFFGACDGYVRDAYPLMLLSQKHLSRNIGDTTLLERIKKYNLGEIERVGEKCLWRIPTEKLTAVQKLLDDSDVTLSGRRLEGVKRAPSE